MTNPRASIRKLNLVGVLVLILLFGGAGGWAAVSQLSGAVIAPGSIVVDSNVKKVQHPNGGVVGRILVRDGDDVRAGQLLIRLDDTLTRATFGIVQSQIDELFAREARLIAERDGADALAFPPHVLARRQEQAVTAALAGEERLFDSRQRARTGQRAQLTERIAQINEEIRGLSAQQKAKEEEIKFIGEELQGVSDLYQKKLVTIVRYTQLQRDHARLQGELGSLIAEIARARGRISETELQIIQLDQDFRTDVLKDLREAQGKLAELQERRNAAEDQLNRVDIHAPHSGVVHQLSVHTVGGVIANGETIMQIVPHPELLVVEARVAPQDIDQVAIGAKALARVMAGNQRTTPDVTGTVTHVSPDLIREQQTNTAYYLVRVTLPEEEVHRIHDLTLVPGMPVELFIQTHSRTALEYLLKPLQEQIARTFRER